MTTAPTRSTAPAAGVRPSRGSTDARDGILPHGMMRLGFGSGGLIHKADRRTSLRLLETALDAGIVYFDTARYYGFGGTEGILGELAARARDRMVVVSKAGILPGSRAISLRLVNRGVLLAHKALPPARAWLRTPSAVAPRFNVFDPREFTASVETSLRELRTSHLDILLLHECTLADVSNEEFRALLQTLKRQGKIRAFGLATGIDETIHIAHTYPELASVVQVPSNIWDPSIRRLPARAGGLAVTHACFSGLDRLLDRLTRDQRFAGRWTSLTQVEPQDRAGIARLLLAHALAANRDGIVLFSSTRPANIRSNVSAIRDSRVSAAQIEGLERLAREELRAATLEPHERMAGVV